MEQQKTFSLDSRKAWSVWGTAALFYAFQFILRVSPSVMADDLMRDLAVDACSLGILTSFYYNAYSALQVPIGSIMDRFGPRRILIGAVFLCMAGCFLFASSHNLWQSALGRLCMGAGSACAFLSCLKFGTLWFESKKVSLVVGLTLTLGVFGAMTGGIPLSSLISTFDWRIAMMILGAGSLILILFIYRFADDHGPYYNGQEESIPLRKALMSIIRQPQTWLIGAIGCLAYVPLSAFADMWGVPYLTYVYEWDRFTAAGAISCFYVGMGLAGPFYAWLSGKLQSYRSCLVIGTFGSCICFSMLLYGPSLPMPAVFSLLFLAGAFIAAQFLCFTLVCDINGKHLSASAGGFHNMLCMFSGVFFQPFVGWLLDSHRFARGTITYSAEDFSYGMVVIPLCLMGGLILTGWVRETYKA